VLPARKAKSIKYNRHCGLAVLAHLLRPRPGAVPSDGWVFEEKIDGWRKLAYKDGDRVRLLSRHGRDHTRRFPGHRGGHQKLSARTMVLDGEVAIYD
jgi:bifunctional non-homologous end joining protein LigD